MVARKPSGFMLCLLPIGGYPKGYVSRWGPYQTKGAALAAARKSGLSPIRQPHAPKGYGPEGRLGRVWIERAGQPATGS